MVIARPFAWRVFNVEDAHTWIGGIAGIHPEKGLLIATEAAVRIGSSYFVYEPCFAKASSSDPFAAVGSFTFLFSNVPKSACTANPLAKPKT